MHIRKLWSRKLTEWVLGSAVAWGCIAPSTVLSGLLTGGRPAGCSGSFETDCDGGTSCVLSGEMPHFCACQMNGNGTCSFANNPCVSPCFLPNDPNGVPVIAGHCSLSDSCYY